jgi:DNA-binding CsgD family transcriptional regulator
MIDWQDLYRSHEQQRLLDSFIEHGLGQNGLTVVHHVQQDIYCTLTATFNLDTDKWPRKKLELLEMLRFHADQISDTYTRGYLLRGDRDYKITPRESECLYWVAMGKTDDQISSLLNIGKWTVNGHLQSAKYKLRTPSRSAAVARALTAGIIKLRRAV